MSEIEKFVPPHAEGFTAPASQNLESTKLSPETGQFNELRLGLVARLNEIHEQNGPIDHQTYLKDLSGELTVLEAISQKILTEGISETSLDFDLPNLYQPRNDTGLRSLSREWRADDISYYSDFYKYLQNIDSARLEVQKEIEDKYSLSPIMSVAGYTKFDPDRHEDSEANRLPAENNEDNNTIYEQIRPGFTIDGKVVRKAFVKRYVRPEPEAEQKSYPEGFK